MTLADASDEQLIWGYVGGDERAFEELVSRYQKRVFGICLRYFRHPVDAEDAAQEVFVTLLRRAETFAGTARFSTWLYRVAINTCNDLARRQARRPRTVPFPDDVDAPSRDAELAARELDADLMAALRSLDIEQRRAVVWHDLYGLGYAEIAAREDVAVGTVKSRVFRGHARLAERLSAPQREPSGADRPPTG